MILTGFCSRGAGISHVRGRRRMGGPCGHLELKLAWGSAEGALRDVCCRRHPLWAGPQRHHCRFETVSQHLRPPYPALLVHAHGTACSGIALRVVAAALYTWSLQSLAFHRGYTLRGRRTSIGTADKVAKLHFRPSAMLCRVAWHQSIRKHLQMRRQTSNLLKTTTMRAA